MEDLFKDMSENFNDLCYAPFGTGQVLIKGVKEDGEMIIYAEASNEGLDQEGETVLQKALMENKYYYLDHGVISWNHQHRTLGDPRFIIGEPLDVRFNTEDRRTLLKGRLYDQNDIALGVWKNIQSKARLGASVGGGILNKSKEGTINKVLWNDTALTHAPMLDSTIGSVTQVPYKEFMKALMAGSGVNAALYTGGRALTSETTRRNRRYQAAFHNRKLYNNDDGDSNGEMRRKMNNREDVKGEYDHVDNSSYKDDPRLLYGMARTLFDALLLEINNGQIEDWKDIHEFINSQNLPDDVLTLITGFIARNVPGLTWSRDK